MPYKPLDSTVSPRFVGVRTFMRLPNVVTTEGIDFAIVGVPFDTGASLRVGQRFGPQAVRSASSLLRGYDPDLDVDIFEYCSGVDYGDVNVVPGYIEDSFAHIVEGLAPLLAAGVVPLTIGGDHSITLAELRAAAQHYGPLALVHLDAHLDTADLFFGRPYFHGTPFRRAAEEGLLDLPHSIQVGMRGSLFSARDVQTSLGLGFAVLPGSTMRRLGVEATASHIRERVAGRRAFLTFDVDFVDPAYAPGTGTPEIGGPTSAEAMDLLAQLAGIPFVGFDLVEVLPAYDHSEITAFLAANLLHRFLSLHALARKKAAIEATK